MRLSFGLHAMILVGCAFDPSDVGSSVDPVSQLRIFDPANFSGYDASGKTESSNAFQAAIHAASVYASAHPGAADLYHPATLANGPNAPQAIVRATRGVFKLSSVYLESNVRLEIDAGAVIIPPNTSQSVALQIVDLPSQGGVNGKGYVDNVTITSHGTSSTFADVGGTTRTKSVKYAIQYPDGSSMSLANKFVVDIDPTRYAASGGAGNGPRYVAIKVRQGRHFLIENMLALANDGNAGVAPNGAVQGSNTYPATASPAIAFDAALGSANTEAAVQPRNGTIRQVHGENCTRGYGITEIHSGVDLDFSYVSARGGMTIRWESEGGGQSTRQTATQCVSHDGNAVYLMSNHGLPQTQLHASYGIAYGDDDGIRTMGTPSKTTQSSMDHVEIHGGTRAQVVKYNNGTDDYWWYDESEQAIDNTLGVKLSNMTCSGSFQRGPTGGSCN